MTKDKLKGFIGLGLIISIVGLVFLFFSVHFGNYFAEDWLFKQDGADTSLYLIHLEGYINSFLTAGGILFGIGLLIVMYGYYRMLQIQE